MPNVGDDLVLEDVRLVVAVRDPGLAAVLALAIVRDRILLADGQVRKRRAAVRRRSRTATPASAGGRGRPLAAAPVQIPSEPAVAGLHALYDGSSRFCRRRPASLPQVPGLRPAETVPPFPRLLHRSLQCPVALYNLPKESRVRPDESRVLPDESRVRPEQRRRWSLTVARQPGSGKCACRFERHGAQELKSGFQQKILSGWTGHAARETLRQNLLPGYLPDVARRRRTRSRKSGRTRDRRRLLKKRPSLDERTLTSLLYPN